MGRDFSFSPQAEIPKSRGCGTHHFSLDPKQKKGEAARFGSTFSEVEVIQTLLQRKQKETKCFHINHSK